MTDTITIEAGKRYKMRSGHVTGVMREVTSMRPDPDRFYNDEKIENFAPMWREDGKSTFFRASCADNKIYDIIEEFTE